VIVWTCKNCRQEVTVRDSRWNGNCICPECGTEETFERSREGVRAALAGHYRREHPGAVVTWETLPIEEQWANARARNEKELRMAGRYGNGKRWHVIRDDGRTGCTYRDHQPVRDFKDVRSTSDVPKADRCRGCADAYYYHDRAERHLAEIEVEERAST
jgi:hypothetical protein